MNNTHTAAVLTVAFVLRLKPQGEGVMQIIFPKLKLGANYFISPVRCSQAQARFLGAVVSAQAVILPEFQGFYIHIH